MASREEILEEAGRALRGARRARGWTLRDVGTRSQGQFTPTAGAGYERGERGISLERFCSLAQLYGMHPERLLSRIMWRIEGGPEPKIDRGRLAQLPREEAGPMCEFIDEVRRLRGDVDEETITIRIQDLEVLATVSGRQLDQFLDDLRPALAVGGEDQPN